MYGFFLQSVAEKNKKSPDTFRENPEYTDRDKIIPTHLKETRYIRLEKEMFPTLLIIKGNAPKSLKPYTNILKIWMRTISK